MLDVKWKKTQFKAHHNFGIPASEPKHLPQCLIIQGLAGLESKQSPRRRYKYPPYIINAKDVDEADYGAESSYDPLTHFTPPPGDHLPPPGDPETTSTRRPGDTSLHQGTYLHQ